MLCASCHQRSSTFNFKRTCTDPRCSAQKNVYFRGSAKNAGSVLPQVDFDYRIPLRKIQVYFSSWKYSERKKREASGLLGAWNKKPAMQMQTAEECRKQTRQAHSCPAFLPFLHGWTTANRVVNWWSLVAPPNLFNLNICITFSKWDPILKK